MALFWISEPQHSFMLPLSIVFLPTYFLMSLHLLVVASGKLHLLLAIFRLGLTHSLFFRFLTRFRGFLLDHRNMLEFLICCFPNLFSTTCPIKSITSFFATKYMLRIKIFGYELSLYMLQWLAGNSQNDRPSPLFFVTLYACLIIILFG